jgi:pimeloyl-ACP methyl ester carboxylesterase
MTDFLLLHGACHDAWCWHATVSELERRGHRALAVELPIDDPAAGAETYADVAAAASRAQFDGPVVAVGHSLSGIVIPLLPERLEIEELVFLCSILPIPGVSMIDQWAREPDMLLLPTAPSPEREPPPPTAPGATEADRPVFGRERAIAAFYHDCPPELAEIAVDHLRPQERKPLAEPSPVSVSAWPPPVRCRYVLARDDRSVNPEWSRREVPARLGVVPIELGGSHSPFLSRPTELVEVLLEHGAAAPGG